MPVPPPSRRVQFEPEIVQAEEAKEEAEEEWQRQTRGSDGDGDADDEYENEDEDGGVGVGVGTSNGGPIDPSNLSGEGLVELLKGLDTDAVQQL